MTTREFSAGCRTSLLGFGCMRFPLLADGKTIDEATASQMLDDALRAGVTYLDTAYVYHEGESEKFLGRCLKKYPRSAYTLATKLPLWELETREDAERIFAQQMDNLQTDYIDFYLLHCLCRENWDKVQRLGLVELLEGYQREGKIKKLGFSFHDEFAVFQEIITARQWDFCQIQYNYMDTDEQAGDNGYALAEMLGVPVVVMEPVRGGALAALPEDIEAVFRAENPQASMASWALRWAASHPQVKVVLSGMSTPQQVQDNLNTFAQFTPLTPREAAAVTKVRSAILALRKNGCTGCRYCMPCPAGVDIPKNFAMWNAYAMYRSDYTREQWAKLEADSAKACARCGKCETVCPQHLPIREHLAAVVADMQR